MNQIHQPKNEGKLKEHGLFNEIPQKYICPICYFMMDEPVYDPRSPMYILEKAAIIKALKVGGRHPYTREPLTESGLVNHHDLKNEIDTYVSARIKLSGIIKSAVFNYLSSHAHCSP